MFWKDVDSKLPSMLPILKLVLDLIKSIKNQSNPTPEPGKEWSQAPQKGMFALLLQSQGWELKASIILRGMCCYNAKNKIYLHPQHQIEC